MGTRLSFLMESRTPREFDDRLIEAERFERGKRGRSLSCIDNASDKDEEMDSSSDSEPSPKRLRTYVDTLGDCIARGSTDRFFKKKSIIKIEKRYRTWEGINTIPFDRTPFEFTTHLFL